MSIMSLGGLTLGLGCLLVAANGIMAAEPGRVLAWLKAFPRNVPSAWVLTIVDLVWAGRLIYFAPLGRFDSLKPLIFVAVPVAILLVGFFVDELLAPRALGGLFILMAAPLLDAARWHPSVWRLVVVILAYGIALDGIMLIVSPYHFRKAAERFLGSEASCRRLGIGGCSFGLLLVFLGLVVY